MAGFLLVSVWCLLLLGASLAPALGARSALLLAYASSAALLLATRPRGAARAPLAAAALAAAAGFVALPAWLALVWVLGSWLGLPPVTGAFAGGGSAAEWLGHVVLAPLFEELLYRERMLPALRERVGAPLALVLSSALFAAPHGEPWPVLTTFCFGLALGGVQLASGRVGLAIAAHAGANAAVLVCGLPPLRAALTPPAAALVSALLLGLALALTRGHAARPAVRAGESRTAPLHAKEARRLHRSRA